MVELANLKETETQQKVEMLQRFGVVVVHNAMRGEEVDRIAAAAQRYLTEVERRVSGGTGFDDVDPRLAFNPTYFAGDWTAIDPDTSTVAKPNFVMAALHRAIMDGQAGHVVRQAIGQNLTWTMPRVRAVFPAGEGTLGIHQERGFAKAPGTHNIWLPLMRDAVANLDTSGIQFFVGHRKEFTELPVDDARIVALTAAVNDAANANDAGYGNGYFYRPELRLGDAVIFDSCMPHGSFVPTTATKTRVSFDVRLFPNQSA
jgi:hypothetical protein